MTPPSLPASIQRRSHRSPPRNVSKSIGWPRPAAVDEEPGRAAHRDGRLLGLQDERQLEGGLGLADDEKAQAVLADGPEVVLRFVEKSIGPRGEPRHFDPRLTLGVVLRRAPGRLAAFLPEAEDRVGRRRALPARTHPVPGGRRIGRVFRSGRARQRLFGRKKRLLGLDEPDDAPGALAGLGCPVEVGPGDRERLFLIGAGERAVLVDPGFDVDEAEPERARRGPRLAALVGHVDRKRVTVGQARSGPVLLLFGPGSEGDVDRAVGADLGPAAGDGLAAAAARLPPPPARVDRLALDLPDGLAARDGEPEVVAGFALERRRLVEPQRLLRVLDRDLEGRPLVLLDTDFGISFRRGVETPAAERPTRRGE